MMQTTNDVRSTENDAGGFLGHPRGLSTLFFTELWERFSYYGMKAFLVVFVVASAQSEGGLGFDKEKASALISIYFSVAYLTGLPGGWIADKFLGQRRAVFWGGVIIMFGHISLAFHSLATFYLGLLLIICGTGLLKTNVSALVGQLYKPGDIRRDAGYSIYYMGINIGAFVGPLIGGWLAQSVTFKKFLSDNGMDPNNSWHWGFGSAAVGMFFGLLQFVLGSKRLGNAGLKVKEESTPEAERKNWFTLWTSIAALVIIVGIGAAIHNMNIYEITIHRLSDLVGLTLIGLPIVCFGMILMSSEYTTDEKKKVGALACLYFISMVFFTGLEQGSSTLNLFAAEKTQCSIFGYEFPSSWFQSLNPLFVVTLAPIFAAIWVRMGEKQPSSPGKFIISMFFVFIAFVIMGFAAKASVAAGPGARVSPLWLTVVFLFITFAELCISPIGLSLVTKLAPQRCVGLIMGVWWIANASAGYLAGKSIHLTEKYSESQVYFGTAVFALGSGILLALLSKPIKKMMGGVS